MLLCRPRPNLSLPCPCHPSHDWKVWPPLRVLCPKRNTCVLAIPDQAQLVAFLQGAVAGALAARTRPALHAANVPAPPTAQGRRKRAGGSGKPASTYFVFCDVFLKKTVGWLWAQQSARRAVLGCLPRRARGGLELSCAPGRCCQGL